MCLVMVSPSPYNHLSGKKPSSILENVCLSTKRTPYLLNKVQYSVCGRSDRPPPLSTYRPAL